MNNTMARLGVLHIVLSIGETSAAYNEHCLPWAGERDITICSFFEPTLDPPDTITLFAGDGSISGFIRTLRSALAAKRYDIIHAHSPHVGLLFLVATLFSLRRYVSRTLFTVHDSYQNFKLRNRLMLIPVFAMFGRVICCGQASLASFPAFYKWLAGNRLGAVQNGLDIARVDRISDRVQRRHHSEFTVVAVSRLVYIKNPFAVLTAFQQAAHPNSRLIYIGDGPMRTALEAEIPKKSMAASITFTGLIPRERVFEHLVNADLFVSTSRGEGLPVAVLEAMSSRCPVLLSDIPPHREIAEGERYIPLIEPDDLAGWAREITRFANMPAAERREIGQKCRALVERRFSLPAMHAAYNEIYTQMIQGRSPSLSERGERQPSVSDTLT